MALLYTTAEAIGRRLRGRLQVGGSQLPFGNTVVNDDLLTQVGEQVEARINARLGIVFKLPLKNPANVLLASVVEKLVICDLYPTHFVDGQTIDNFGKMMCDQGSMELEELLKGIEGEELVSGQETVNTSYSLAGKRQPLPIADKDRDVMRIKW